MVLLEARVNVRCPIELVHNEIEVLVFVLGHIFDQQRPRHFAALNERLIHAEHVRAPLRLIGAQRTGCVQDARADQPSAAWLQTIRFRKIKDAIVTPVPMLEAFADIVLGRAGLQPEKRVRKIVAHVIVLRREIIRLRLPFLADELRLLLVLMHVQRNRPHVVEELGVDRPFFVFVPNFFPDNQRTAIVHRLLQREPLLADDDVAQPFVRRAVFVRGGRGER